MRVPEVKPRRRRLERDLPRALVLPATVLGMEGLLRMRALDLRAAAELLRGDPGALLQMYRLLAEEGGEAPVRLEECLASVSVERLRRRLAKACSGQVVELEAFARHAAAIGRGAEAVAETLGLRREEAWTVGMLHELGSWPGVRVGDKTLRCKELARRYKLPAGMCEALEEVHREVEGSVWRAVVAAAHELQVAA